MSKKTSMYCFCDAARFSGGSLTTPSSDVIEISLKFEKINNGSSSNVKQQRKLNFVELSEKTLKDVCINDSIHDCIKDLLQSIIIKKSSSSSNIPQIITPSTTPLSTTTTITNVTVHQQPMTAITMDDDNIYVNFSNDEGDNFGGDLKIVKRNSSKRSSMKSSKSMETILEKSLKERQKDKSPDESKAKSVGNINNDDDENEKDCEYENGESIELIFISDEFVNKMNRVKEEVIIVDGKVDDRRRESLTNKKKLVIITDDYKEKVLRNNSIVMITNEKKMLKKLNKKSSKTYNTHSNSFLPYDEPELNDDENIMEDKRLDEKKPLAHDKK